MNNRVLIVEDSKSFRHYLESQIGQINLEVTSTDSVKGAQYILDNDTDFLCAVLDFCLPDGPDGEVIDLALSYGLKVIVVTAKFDEQMRDTMLAKGVIDYILKDSYASVSYLLPLLTRLNRNKRHKALVVDDSLAVRNHLVQLLEHHYIQAIEASNGVEALEALENTTDITLVITDNNMPEKDGITLTKEVRLKKNRSELAILGISTTESKTVTAQFLKSGANDYLKKPFNQEEFYCRVQNLLHMKDINDDMFKLANQDALTGLWNRRYLFEQVENGGQAHNNVAMLDIDFFKKINDKYGHDGGDQALVTVSHIISIYFKEDLTARFGGEEFCILNNGRYDEFVQRLENMRQRIESTAIPYLDTQMNLTISIGTTKAKRDIDTMIRIADDRLYQAKSNGRNQTVSADIE